MKTKLKYISIGIGLVALGAGITYFVNFQISLYKNIVATQAGLMDVVKFTNQEFPNQVKEYVASQQTQTTTPATSLPDNAVKK